MKKYTMEITTTKRGIPALWERGGGMTSGGSVTIITGRNGEPRRPVYVPRGGHLCCGDHALICLHDGFYVVQVNVRHGDLSSASVSRVISTNVVDIDGEKWKATAEVELINQFNNGEWDRPLEEKLKAAVKAAYSKACDYHCRSAYYIDTTDKKSEVSEPDKRRREEEMRCQDVEREKLRKAKADREAQAKAEAEAMSKSAKEGGLGARLEAINIRLATLGRNLVELGETSFKYGWYNQSYKEEAIASIERDVAQYEAEEVEKERKRKVRETFQPKFEVFISRIEALGLKVEFTADNVKFVGDYYGQPYSDEGVARLVADLDKREREMIDSKAKAEAEIIYQRRKDAAVVLGLPTDVCIWCRRGGRTNVGDGWVIGPDGQDRSNTAWHNPRSRYSSEGDKIWEQILEGEVVLKWSKAYTAAEHCFEVIHLPTGGLTEAQLERILEIEDALEREWEGATGLASGLPSPSVGNGWNL